METIEHLKGKKVFKRESSAGAKKIKLSLDALKGEVLATEDRIERELKEVAFRASPGKIKADTVEYLLNHPSRWGILAFGSGFVGSSFLSRKLHSRKA